MKESTNMWKYISSFICHISSSSNNLIIVDKNASNRNFSLIIRYLSLIRKKIFPDPFQKKYFFECLPHELEILFINEFVHFHE